MNDLVLANRAADWRRLKGLVLDSVSSPITKRVYNLTGRIHRMAWPRTEARLHKGHRQRLARCSGSPPARVGFDQRADHGGPQGRRAG